MTRHGAELCQLRQGSCKKMQSHVHIVCIAIGLQTVVCNVCVHLFTFAKKVPK